jgi:excisionase family DNA binding protein
MNSNTFDQNRVRFRVKMAELKALISAFRGPKESMTTATEHFTSAIAKIKRMPKADLPQSFDDVLALGSTPDTSKVRTFHRDTRQATKHVLKLWKGVRGGVIDTINACADESYSVSWEDVYGTSNLLEWPEQGERGGDLWGCDDSFPNSFSIQASEDFTFEPLLGVPEAAKLLGIHPKTLQAMARAGSVPCVRFGKYWRFRASVLDAWVRDRLTSDHQSRRVS